MKKNEYAAQILANAEKLFACGYKYGSKWLYEPVPENVVEFLKNLPSIGG